MSMPQGTEESKERFDLNNLSSAYFLFHTTCADRWLTVYNSDVNIYPPPLHIEKFTSSSPKICSSSSFIPQIIFLLSPPHFLTPSIFTSPLLLLANRSRVAPDQALAGFVSGPCLCQSFLAAETMGTLRGHEPRRGQSPNGEVVLMPSQNFRSFHPSGPNCRAWEPQFRCFFACPFSRGNGERLWEMKNLC